MSYDAGYEWGSGVPISGKRRPKSAKYSLRIGEIELIYTRSAFKVFSKHKSILGALHEGSLPSGSLVTIELLRRKSIEFVDEKSPVGTADFKIYISDPGRRLLGQSRSL